MRLIILFTLWAVLLTPSINLGRAWHTSAMPGPQVTVHFADAQVTGFYVYKIDGSEWVVDDSGNRHRLSGREVISGAAPIQSARFQPWKHWRAVLPLIMLTLVLWVLSLRIRKY